MNYTFNTNVHNNGKAVIGHGNVINLYPGAKKRNEDSKKKEDDDVSDKTVPTSGIQETNEPAEEPDFIYLMKTGYVAVIHNLLYPKRTDDSWRDGSEKDAAALRKFFKDDLGFQHREYKNLKADDLLKQAEELSEKDYNRFDAFFFIILSHGNDKGILCVDEETVAIDAITNFFTVEKCPTLGNKPKVFIIQACRGFTDDPGADVEDSNLQIAPVMKKFPIESDFVIAYSSPYGYTSFRSITNGSWYIQSLVEVLKKHHEQDHLLDILLRVNFLIAKYQTKDCLKQMPSFECRLSKKCFFQLS